MTNSRIGIPDKVRGVAAEKGYTQDRIALTIGISRTQLVERLGGRTPFKADEILTLAFEMRVPVERFFPTEAEMLHQPPTLVVTQADALTEAVAS